LKPPEKASLEAVDLVKIYSMPGAELTVLSGLDFRPRRGNLTAVVGASGTGKSTLLHILGTLDRPTRGEVRYEGKNLFALSSRALARHRNRLIGFVFQFHHLLPEFTALENVMMPGLVAHRSREEVEARGINLLEAVGLRNRAQHRPGELSGGEQQRVAVARALFNEPLLLLADEPSGNLDRESSEELHRLLRRLVRETGQTTVVATHDDRLAAEADEVYRLSEGKLHPLRVLADNGRGAEGATSARNHS
jgi:lipoprotein-releasing system ATP-binding protein